MSLVSKKDVLQTLKLLIAAAVLLAGMGAVHAFVGPPGAPPTCPAGKPGCDAPLNTGGAAQSKIGHLDVASLSLSNELITFGSNMIVSASTGVTPFWGVWNSGTIGKSGFYLRDSASSMYGGIYGEGSGQKFGLVVPFGGGPLPTNAWILEHDNGNYTRFSIANSPKMTIQSSGNVDVVGEVNATQFNGPATNLNCTAGNCVQAGEVDFTYAGSGSKGGPANTANALSANPANCPAGQFAAGINENGVAEGCVTPVASITSEGLGASVPASTSCFGATLVPQRVIVDVSTNRLGLQYESCVAGSLSDYTRFYFGKGEWAACVDIGAPCALN